MQGCGLLSPEKMTWNTHCTALMCLCLENTVLSSTPRDKRSRLPFHISISYSRMVSMPPSLNAWAWEVQSFSPEFCGKVLRCRISCSKLDGGARSSRCGGGGGKAEGLAATPLPKSICKCYLFLPFQNLQSKWPDYAWQMTTRNSFATLSCCSYQCKIFRPIFTTSTLPQGFRCSVGRYYWSWPILAAR